MKDARAVPGVRSDVRNYYQKIYCNIYHILYFSIGDENYFPDVKSNVPADQLNCFLFTD